MAIEHDTLFVDSLNSPATSSSASLDLDHPFESTPSSSSPSHPSSPSLIKLNACAAAFIPRSTSTPSLSSAMLSKSSSSPALASMSPSPSSSSRHGSRIGPGSGHVNGNGQTVLHVIATPPGAFHPIATHVPVHNYIYASQLPVQYAYGGRGFVDHGGMPAVVVIGADSERLSDEACQKIVNQARVNLSLDVYQMCFFMINMFCFLLQ